jgi:hypothetical protein
MRLKFTGAFGYLWLLLCSLGVPFLHLFLADGVIEQTRMGMGFLPAHFWFGRCLGELALLFPLVIIACFLISLRYEPFTRATTLFGLATVQLAFITVYGVYSAVLLSHLLLNGSA